MTKNKVLLALVLIIIFVLAGSASDPVLFPIFVFSMLIAMCLPFGMVYLKRFISELSRNGLIDDDSSERSEPSDESGASEDNGSNENSIETREKGVQ